MSEVGRFLLPLLLDGGIQALELDACIRCGKLPMHCGHLLIAILLPVLHLLTQLIDRGNVVFQALAGQDREFNLGDVEPAGVLWRIVDLQPVEQSFRLGGRKGVVERDGRMGVEVVQHQDHFVGCWVMHREQFFDEVRPVFFRAPGRHLEVALAPQRLTGDEQIALPFLARRCSLRGDLVRAWPLRMGASL